MSSSQKDAERSEILKIRLIRIRGEKISHQIKKGKSKNDLAGNYWVEDRTKKVK